MNMCCAIVLDESVHWHAWTME